MNSRANSPTWFNKHHLQTFSSIPSSVNDVPNVLNAGSSSAILSSHYYTQSETEGDGYSKRWKRDGYDQKAESCDESEWENLFCVTKKKLRRTQSSSSTAISSREPDSSQMLNSRQKCNRRNRQIKFLQQKNLNTIQLDGMQFANKNRRETNARMLSNSNNNRSKDVFYKCYTSTPNSKLAAKIEVPKKKKVSAKKRTPSNTNDRLYHQQKIADYYRTTTRRKANYYFTTKDDNIILGSGNYGNRKCKDNTNDDNCPFYNRRSHFYQRHHKTPITTSAKRHRHQNIHLSSYKTQKRKTNLLENDEYDVGVCKSPVLLDICTEKNATPVSNRKVIPLQERLDLVNDNCQSLCPIKSNTFEAQLATTQAATSNQTCCFCQKKSSLIPAVNNKENALNLKNDQMIHYYNGVDSGCIEDVESLTKTDFRKYGNICDMFNKNTNDDDDETQFMNISDKIYENLVNVASNNHTDVRSPLKNVNKNEKVSSFSTTTTTMLPILSSTLTTDRSNCSTMTNGTNSTKANVFTSPLLNDEPELYARLVGTVLREARQYELCFGDYRSKSLQEAQHHIEKLLYSDNLCGKQKFPASLKMQFASCNSERNAALANPLLPKHDQKPYSNNSTFERDCEMLCALITEKLRRTRATSVKDYNEQILKVQKIISQLKNSALSLNQRYIYSANDENRNAAMFSTTANNNNNNSSGKTIQKFFGKIGKLRSMF